MHIQAADALAPPMSRVSLAVVVLVVFTLVRKPAVVVMLVTVVDVVVVRFSFSMVPFRPSAGSISIPLVVLISFVVMVVVVVVV